MLTIKYETIFKKDYKRIIKRGYDLRRWSLCLPMKTLSRQSITTIRFPAIISAIANVISPLTGF